MHAQAGTMDFQMVCDVRHWDYLHPSIFVRIFDKCTYIHMYVPTLGFIRGLILLYSSI